MILGKLDNKANKRILSEFIATPEKLNKNRGETADTKCDHVYLQNHQSFGKLYSSFEPLFDLYIDWEP